MNKTLWIVAVVTLGLAASAFAQRGSRGSITIAPVTPPATPKPVVSQR